MRGIEIVLSPEPFVNGQLKGNYSSMLSCAKELGLQESHISEVCSGKRKQHKGFIFRKVDNYANND